MDTNYGIREMYENINVNKYNNKFNKLKNDNNNTNIKFNYLLNDPDYNYLKNNLSNLYHKESDINKIDDYISNYNNSLRMLDKIINIIAINNLFKADNNGNDIWKIIVANNFISVIFEDLELYVNGNNMELLLQINRFLLYYLNQYNINNLTNFVKIISTQLLKGSYELNVLSIKVLCKLFYLRQNNLKYLDNNIIANIIDIIISNQIDKLFYLCLKILKLYIKKKLKYNLDIDNKILLILTNILSNFTLHKDNFIYFKIIISIMNLYKYKEYYGIFEDKEFIDNYLNVLENNDYFIRHYKHSFTIKIINILGKFVFFKEDNITYLLNKEYFDILTYYVKIDKFINNSLFIINNLLCCCDNHYNIILTNNNFSDILTYVKEIFFKNNNLNILEIIYFFVNLLKFVDINNIKILLNNDIFSVYNYILTNDYLDNELYIKVLVLFSLRNMFTNINNPNNNPNYLNNNVIIELRKLQIFDSIELLLYHKYDYIYLFALDLIENYINTYK